MKKLIKLLLIGLIVSSCNKPKQVLPIVKPTVTVQVKYFDNTLDTIVIDGYKGIENDLNLDGGDLFIINPYPYVYASQVKTYKILKQ